MPGCICICDISYHFHTNHIHTLRVHVYIFKQKKNWIALNHIEGMTEDRDDIQVCSFAPLVL